MFIIWIEFRVTCKTSTHTHHTSRINLFCFMNFRSGCMGVKLLMLKRILGKLRQLATFWKTIEIMTDFHSDSCVLLQRSLNAFQLLLLAAFDAKRNHYRANCARSVKQCIHKNFAGKFSTHFPWELEKRGERENGKSRGDRKGENRKHHKVTSEPGKSLIQLYICTSHVPSWAPAVNSNSFPYAFHSLDLLFTLFLLLYCYLHWHTQSFTPFYKPNLAALSNNFCESCSKATISYITSLSKNWS